MEPQRYRVRTEIEEAAEKVLRDAGINDPPVDPIVIARSAGIRIFNAEFSDPSISGLLTRRGNSITMLINQKDAAYRKRFTIAHELGHHFLHLPLPDEHITRDADLFRVPRGEEPFSRAEYQANTFASALLMPRSMLTQRVTMPVDIDQLAAVFQVSTEAMGYRLSQLEML